MVATTTRLPLVGYTVLVTRARAQAGALTELLEHVGATVVELPSIEIVVANLEQMDAAIQDLTSVDWIVFTSANGVSAFADRLNALGMDRTTTSGAIVCAIGRATAAQLRERGIRVDFVPERAIAESVVAELAGLGIDGKRVLLPQAEIARDTVAAGLRQAGADVEVVVAYRTVMPDGYDDEQVRRLLDGVDFATFASPSSIRNAIALAGGSLPGMRVVCIGPVTAAAACEAGLTVAAVAGEHSIAGLVDAVVRLVERGEEGFQMSDVRDGQWPPFRRFRRLRQREGLRRFARETVLLPSDFVYPLFVTFGHGVRREVPSMPDVFQVSVDQLGYEAEELRSLGVGAVLLFGIPEHKDGLASDAYDSNGIIQQAIRELKRVDPELVVIGDVCCCEYTDHGHCGILHGEMVDNDQTLSLLARIALAQAEAGVDIVAPSDMMDCRVLVLRQALDQAGHVNLPILSYAAKYASGFYGPFRDAAESTPAFGDRRSHQMDWANAREALAEIATDLVEGADAVLIKPAMPYLDVIAKAHERFDVPIAAYNVSGEYAMVRAAGRAGWIDERRVTMEILTSIRRAGASQIITYHAKDAARWLLEEYGWESAARLKPTSLPVGD